MKLVVGVFVFYTLVNAKVLVLAQSVSVNLRVVTPAFEVRLGSEARLQCSFIGVSLAQDPVVEWRTPNKTLVWNGVSFTNNIAVSQLALDQATGVITQHMDISRLRLSDTGTYICNVRSLKDGGGSRIEATDSVILNVTDTYFPTNPPVCNPSGEVVVSVGDVIPLSCRSDPGRPVVTITVHRYSEDVTNTFVATETNGDLIRSSDLTVGLEDEGVTLICTITSPRYFPALKESCSIGPLILSSVETSAAPQHSSTMETSSGLTTAIDLISESSPSSQNTTVIALASSLGVLITLCMIACLMLTAPAGMFSSKRAKSSRSSSVARVHPKSNEYDDQRAMSLEIFTTQEGVTDYAYAITDIDDGKSVSDTCSIPLYSVVMSPAQSQIPNGSTSQETSAIVADQESPVSDQGRHKVVTKMEKPATTSASAQDLDGFVTVTDRDVSPLSSMNTDQPPMIPDHEIPANVSASVSHQGMSPRSQPSLLSLPLRPPPPPPPPPPPI